MSACQTNPHGSAASGEAARSSASPGEAARSAASPGDTARSSASPETRADIDALAARLAAQHEQPAHIATQHEAPSREPRQIAAAAVAASAPAAPFTPEQGECETHGAYPLNLLDADGTLRWHTPGCPACRRTDVARSLMQRAAIAPRFENCRFDNFIAASEAQRSVLDQCKRYAREFPAMLERGVCLVLRGNPGTGKNHLATAITRHVIKHGATVLNVTAHEIVVRVREGWHGNEGSGARLNEREVIAEFAAVDLLVIDEVGRSYRTRDGADPVELFNVIDARYRGMKPTLLISNLEGDGIREAIGAAAYDRLREGGGNVLNFTWDSHRISTPET